jgi:hypothetical protein
MLIRIFSIVLLISALPCCPTLANGVKESRNFAAVSWVLFDNRDDFRNAIPLAERTFCASKSDGTPNSSSSFFVPKENYFSVPLSAKLESKDALGRINPDSFETRVKQALDQIRNESEPNLIINLDSHGGIGRVCQQDMDSIEHSRFADVLIRQISEFKKNTGKEPIGRKFFFS